MGKSKKSSGSTEEDSGFSCSYYEVMVGGDCLYKDDKEPYLAECGEIIEALEMEWAEANIFKSIWRIAAAKKGKKKKGNTTLRDAEKVLFAAQRLYNKEKAREDSSV